MVDYAQPSTSAAVLSERNSSSSPTDGPVKINPTGSFDSFYELGKKLASKSHGIVHEGIRKSDDKQVIIKFVKKRRFDFHIGQSEPLCREAAIMRIMKHSDHVVKLYDWFDMEDHNILVMERPGTSITLCDFIRENGGRLTEAVAKDIMQKLIAAFRLFSERGVYYKDISLKKVLIDPDTMQIKITGFYRALTISETQTAKLKSVAERRIQALMATNEGLYRVLKGMVEAKSLKLWFGWKNTRLSKECQDLLRKLRDRESEITLQNMLDHDWFKKTPGTDALESDGNMQFEAMDSSSAQPSSRSPTDVPSQNNPTVREGKMEDKDLLSDLQDISDSERKTITPESSSLGSGTEEEEGEENEEEESSSQSEGESGSESEGPEHSGGSHTHTHTPQGNGGSKSIILV
ncbi:serine/threonine-protein kinase pim-3-like [Siphateles boraxobius]|uniref:serine/threonine-protein kinase pim-3-like n=1 Tax=Siphateles boraxobius TaxID=180520 RepID=UPI0040628343